MGRWGSFLGANNPATESKASIKGDDAIVLTWIQVWVRPAWI